MGYAEQELKKLIMLGLVAAAALALVFLALLSTGCAGIWDATFKVLDATSATIDCADGGEYTADQEPLLEE